MVYDVCCSEINSVVTLELGILAFVAATYRILNPLRIPYKTSCLGGSHSTRMLVEESFWPRTFLGGSPGTECKRLALISD